MKRAFVTTANGGLKSALVPASTQDILRIGSRITTTRMLNLGVTVIAAGESGTVDFIDLNTGLVEILLDVLHWGLAAWENHMWLEPFGTDDIIDGIACNSSSLALQKIAA